ncbi:MAG: M20/M25/M40 family metallo-hydrolase [Solirubrobacterales bacterium]
MTEPLFERFTRLCEIASPTGSERRVADAVAAELRELGCEVFEDDRASEARAGAGNLVARLPGSGEGWAMFCGHLDTVPHDKPVEVKLADGVFRSKGETILGADNKAAVAVLIELVARHSGGDPPPVGIELLLTVAEEDGLRGASAFDVSQLYAPFGFVLDHASPIGELIVAAPTYKRLEATFNGTEAHSGINPEDGHNAIAAAAAAIEGMELGRLDPETTANVGVIEGGSASNIVAGRCRISAEARSIDGAKAAGRIGAMVDSCTWAASGHGCDLDIEVIEMFRGYQMGKDSRAVEIAAAALERCGHAVSRVATGGGSDANALLAAGYETVLLANGTAANHTPDEWVPAANLTAMVEVCEAILVEAARC